MKSFRKGGGGGSDWFHTSILFFQTPSKHTSNTLQHPSSTLKTPINTLQTTFKIIFFFDQKMVGKKINRDFIKGGQGGGSPFYEVVSQKIFFFHNWWLPITWYWCQNIRDNMVEKRVNKFGQGSPPPLFGQCPKENIVCRRCSLTSFDLIHPVWKE